jgi:hypothetical protein
MSCVQIIEKGYLFSANYSWHQRNKKNYQSFVSIYTNDDILFNLRSGSSSHGIQEAQTYWRSTDQPNVNSSHIINMQSWAHRSFELSDRSKAMSDP